MKCLITRDRAYAPCCFILCRIDEQGNWNARDEANTILIQTDWDFPSIASCLGFTPCEECGETDGTIDCSHHTAGEMIEAAQEWLDEHLEEEFEDPGYFS